MMALNKINKISVGADLSCPPPIYRPSVVLKNPFYSVLFHCIIVTG